MRGWIGLVALSAVACTQESGVGGEEQPRTWDGPFLIDSVVIDCDGYTSWTYDVWTQGWGDLITVEVAVDPLSGLNPEYHQLAEADYGEDWAFHSVELDQVTSPADYVDSEATAIPCEAKTFVTYVVAAWRYGGDLEECISWGLDPAGVAPQCANWGEVGHR